jgi:hypothetical protein
MLSDVFHAVIFVAIPAIILLMLGVSVFIVLRARSEFRASAIAGLCTGLVLWVTYVFSSFSGAQTPELGVIRPPSFNWVPLAAGIVVGFTILLSAHYFDRMRAGMVGLFVMFLSSTSLTGVFSYFFASSVRGITIYVALGSLLGILLHLVFFSGLIREVLTH